MQSSRSILITGASSGIGHACARRFLDAGWRVGLLARRTALLEQLAGDRADALVLPCDITQASQVDDAFAAARDRFGRLDVLFNNAGVFPAASPIDELDPAEWDRTVAVNLTGAMRCARAAFGWMRHQRPRGGRILNNGSVSALAPRPGSAAYTATKHALTGLTKSLALDGRAHDIACGQIDIGNADTEMVAGIGRGALQADGSVRPEPRMEVEHVVDLVFHLASLPLHVNVPFVTIKARDMPLYGRG